MKRLSEWQLLVCRRRKGRMIIGRPPRESEGQHRDANNQKNRLSGGASAFAGLDGKVRARLSFCLDCNSIVQWCNGEWKLFNPRYREPLVNCMDVVAELQVLGCATRGPSWDWFNHIARDQNRRADQLARESKDECEIHADFPWPRLLQIRSDGGVNDVTGAGCGWVVWGCVDSSEAEEEAAWTPLASASWRLSAHPLPIEAEFAGILSALKFLQGVVAAGGLSAGGVAERERETPNA